MSDQKHPSSLSAEALAALQASDPSAFDQDSDADADADGEGGGTDAAGAAAGGADAGSAPAEGAVAGTAAGGGDAAAGTAAASGADAGAARVVPAARLAEVVGQRNAAETMVANQAAELAALRERLAAATAAPPKDFEAAYLEAEKRFDDGLIDQSEWEKEKRQLQREEFQHISKVEALQEQTTTMEAAVARSWNEEVKAWRDSCPGFLDKEGNAEVFNRALNSVAAFHGDKITDAELLKRASEMAFEATGYVPPAKAAAAAKTGEPAAGDAGAARRAQNAMRAADASATPGAVAGGVGERGGPGRDIDLTHVKPGTFSKSLSKADQEALLGPGAV